MTEVVFVLDASAVLAVFFGEPGAEAVADRMEGALLCSVNYCEVVAKLVDPDTPAEQIVEIMEQLDVGVVPADRELAMRAGLLRAEARGKALSLGDQYRLALAASRNAVGVTADRAWADLLALHCVLKSGPDAPAPSETSPFYDVCIYHSLLVSSLREGLTRSLLVLNVPAQTEPPVSTNTP